jgi:hypothetical protein
MKIAQGSSQLLRQLFDIIRPRNPRNIRNPLTSLVKWSIPKYLKNDRFAENILIDRLLIGLAFDQSGDVA